MQKYVCSICGFVYDEAAGYPQGGIAPGTKWDDVPEDWVCPLCGATKNEFKLQNEPRTITEIRESSEEETESVRELSFGELSALCSNLSKGCEKQYRTEEASLFLQLSEYFKQKSTPVSYAQLSELMLLIDQDLSGGFDKGNQKSLAAQDRGALRALTWSEKVTRILSSLLNRYENQKDSILENTNIYVCEICGFVYIGDDVPAICPICKVPSLKIAQIPKGVA
jgi:rubredoxin